MNADYSTEVIGRPERMIYRFSIIGYLFGREMWRKTFFCEDKNRGIVYAEWYLKNRVAKIACDQYRVEVWDKGATSTVLGEDTPVNTLPWRADCAEEVSRMPLDRATFMMACNQAGWKERAKKPRARSKHMKVGYGTGRH